MCFGDGDAQYAVVATDEYIELRVSGEVDVASETAHSKVLDRVDELLTLDEVPIHVNLADVTFFGSTGLTLLLRLKQRADDADVGFALHDVPDVVQLVIAASGLRDHFESGRDA